MQKGGAFERGRSWPVSTVEGSTSRRDGELGVLGATLGNGRNQAPVGGTAGPRGDRGAAAGAARAATGGRSDWMVFTSSPTPASDPTRADISAGTITVFWLGLSASLAKASTYFWATK